MTVLNRRGFLETLPALAVVPAIVPARQMPASPSATPHDIFPRQAPALAQEIVSVSHGNLERVKELVSATPALARAVWDWGYGDWESALGAASHVGRKEIAAVLIAAGAPPTIFSAAMLGQLEIVKGLIAASPGIQRTRGPHGITLLDHAKAGEATEVVKYLESLGDADPGYPSEPMNPGDPDALLGTYAFGPGAADRLVVSRNNRGALVMKREGQIDRNLFHHGGRVFNPSGAEAVRIRFEPASGATTSVVIADGLMTVTARRL